MLVEPGGVVVASMRVPGSRKSRVHRRAIRGIRFEVYDSWYGKVRPWIRMLPSGGCALERRLR